MNIPEGKFQDAAAEERKKLREKLKAKQSIKIKPGDGTLNPSNSGQGMQIPEGKLADFYWYERDKELYNMELQAMRQYFPQFSMEKLDDNRLSWVGEVQPLEDSYKWTLQAVYDNNHPNNSNWGGSIKIYSVYPDLEDIARDLGGIPHTLTDNAGNIYLCTARKEDVKVGNVTTSAASALAWAIKWIAIFDMWTNNEISTSDFQSHKY